MISKKLVDAINTQINKEIYSGYFYMAMSAYMADLGLNGMASWFEAQTQEELAHAKILYNYLLQQGEKVKLQAIDQPPSDFKSALDCFEQTFVHEQYVSKLINELYVLAKNENDYPTEILLQWFVTEQVEEEATASEIVQKLKLIGKDASGLFMMDTELGKRVFTPPSLLSKA